MKFSLINAVSTASLLCSLPHAAAQRHGGGKAKALSEKLQSSITTKGYDVPAMTMLQLS
jgi:hypothetical protein